MRSSSTAVKIKFTHVAKDGRTPVFDTALNKWKYLENPSAESLSASADRLMQMEADAADSTVKADLASVKAQEARSVADSKATAGEAVSRVKDDMFEVYDKDGRRLEVDKIKLYASGHGFTMDFCVLGLKSIEGDFTVAPGASVSPFCARMGYVTMEDYLALLERVAALEDRLGI